MKTYEFTLPEFLLAEFPIKTGDPFNDNRHFIVHKGITLIEVIPNEIFIELQKIMPYINDIHTALSNLY